jgi:hypothetical protein
MDIILAEGCSEMAIAKHDRRINIDRRGNDSCLINRRINDQHRWVMLPAPPGDAISERALHFFSIDCQFSKLLGRLEPVQVAGAELSGSNCLDSSAD